MSTNCLLPWAPTSSGDFPKTQHPQKSPTRSSSSFTCEPLLTCFKTAANVSQPGARPWAKIFIIMTSGEPQECTVLLKQALVSAKFYVLQLKKIQGWKKIQLAQPVCGRAELGLTHPLYCFSWIKSSTLSFLSACHSSATVRILFPRPPDLPL